MPVWYIERTDSSGNVWAMLHAGLFTSIQSATDFVNLKLGGGEWVDGVYVSNLGRYEFRLVETFIQE